MVVDSIPVRKDDDETDRADVRNTAPLSNKFHRTSVVNVVNFNAAYIIGFNTQNDIQKHQV